ncbi:RPM1-interacting protein 4-like [Hibiscus syriacus]|uniref:RPM1-interacting protein 4-like n=1 Tax=Hibiscus syriacus TaxID=106335 RepID=UPI001923B953|nr:RPM1-interacting protein 4-like [Hibiscus syriacus]
MKDMSFPKEQEDMPEAQLGSHVPKFGDWDNDDLSYTAYFENARKEKDGKIMNPNDPEENPKAFMYMRRGLEINQDCQHAVESSKSEHKKNARRQRKKGPESVEENSSGSVRTLTHSNHHRRTSSGPKIGPSGEGSFSAAVSGQSQRNYEYKHHRTASVPKFGEWDEADPTSGAGFTVIFNKVKEQKHAPPASNSTTVAQEVKTMNDSDRHHSKCPTPWGSKSKICCCLF